MAVENRPLKLPLSPLLLSRAADGLSAEKLRGILQEMYGRHARAGQMRIIGEHIDKITKSGRAALVSVGLHAVLWPENAEPESGASLVPIASRHPGLFATAQDIADELAGYSHAHDRIFSTLDSVVAAFNEPPPRFLKDL